MYINFSDGFISLRVRGCFAMKKILFVATVAEHFFYFHLPCFKMFKDKGWQVDVACHGDRELPYCDNKFEIPIKRSPVDK